MSGLPVFDLAGLESAFAGGGQRAEDARAELRAALCEQGLFYVNNMGVDVDAVAAAVRAATEPAMDLPDEDAAPFLNQVGNDGLPRGLSRFGVDSVAASVGKGSYPDLCAKWKYRNQEDDVVPPGGAEAWAAAHDAWDSVAVRLLVLIGQALGLAGTERWEDLVATGENGMNFNRYPDVTEDRAADVFEHPERMAPHSDLDVVTLLHQTPCANGFVSLQAWLNEEWVDVPARPGCLVVNFGEALSILSSGAVKATLHRVISPPSGKLEGSARTSLVLFRAPRFTFSLKPLADSVLAAHAGEADDVTFGQWLMNFLSAMDKSKGNSAAPASSL